MIGSKLMFAGYQSSQKMRPFLAGLIGQDALLVHDEAHLTPAFGHLIRQIIQIQQKQDNPRPLRMIELSATRRES
jgi:CRISPR-associated endonuclease/helicase Cas3